MRGHKKYRTEAEVQAELYAALKAESIEVGLEQKIVLSSKTRTGRNQSIRIDVGIFRDHFLVAVIEVKNSPSDIPPEKSKSRQRRKYEELGLPYKYCMNIRQIEKTVSWAKFILA